MKAQIRPQSSDKVYPTTNVQIAAYYPFTSVQRLVKSLKPTLPLFPQSGSGHPARADDDLRVLPRLRGRRLRRVHARQDLPARQGTHPQRQVIKQLDTVLPDGKI